MPKPIVAILASPDRNPADVYLANEVIRTFDTPLILVQRSSRAPSGRRIRKLLHVGPGGMLEWWLNRRFEARRQQEMREDLTARFATAGCLGAYVQGPRIVEVDDVHSDDSLELLAREKVKVLFQNGAGIIRAPLIRAYAGRILNVHHGYLPAIRGCHSIAWALLENRPDWIGVSVHVIDEGLDTGPILARERIPLSPGDTWTSLFFAATLSGGRLLTRAIADVAAGACPVIPRAEPGEYRPAMTRRGWLALQARTVDTPSAAWPARTLSSPNPLSLGRD